MTTGTTAADLFADDRSIVVARVNGELRDLAHELADGDVVEPVPVDSPTRASPSCATRAAHVLAQAVQEVDPQARLGIGPPIRDGFYYDFDVEKPFTPEDLKALEKAMQRIVKEGQTLRRRVVTDDEARAELADEPYKLELIGLKGGAADDDADRGRRRVEVGAGELTIYDNVAPRRRRRLEGPVPRPARAAPPGCSATAGSSCAAPPPTGGASEKNPQLQRVYGTAWPTKDELKAYLDRLAEAERRDHRKLGAELDLFSLPRRDRLRACRCSTPRAASSSARWRTTSAAGTSRRASSTSAPRTSPRSGLFQTSGHLPYYADTHVPADGAGGQPTTTSRR